MAESEPPSSPTSVSATTVASTVDLRKDVVTNDARSTVTSDERPVVNEKENSKPDAENQLLSHEAQRSSKGKEKAKSQTPTAASRDPSPLEPNSPAIDDEAVLQSRTTILASSASDDYNDDGYNSDGLSGYSTSLSTSVNDYIFSHGRRYHRFREGAYHFPNDDAEQEREEYVIYKFVFQWFWVVRSSLRIIIQF